jgi:protein-disulfide isomerase
VRAAVAAPRSQPNSKHKEHTNMSQTKRELREQRRAAREAAERAEAAAATRRRRVWRLAGVAALAAIVVAVAAIVSSLGGADENAPAATSGAAELVAGIPEHDGVLGDPKAPVTVTEYLDLQCPICAEASRSALPHLIDTYVKTGKVKLQARTLSFIGPDSVTAAKWAAAAKQQGKLWAFLETFYASQGQENSGYVTDDFLADVADAAGVNAGQAKDFARTAGAQDALDTADGDAQALGVDSTPTFTMSRNGTAQKIVAVGADDLTAKLDKALS